MKTKFYLKSIILTLIVSLLLITACKKSDPKESDENKIVDNTPVLTTSTITNITPTTATSGGTIKSNGGETITACGVCWSTSLNPTTANNKTVDGAGADVFISNITGLTPGTIYYVRAYVTNKNGTIYGNQISFTAGIELPTLSTTAISNITSTSATSGGNITNTGGGTITARGVCWSTSVNPTIDSSRTLDGNTNSFTSNISGLLENTTYYVRAYATNAAGTTYGNQISFKTHIDIEFVNVQGGTFIMGNDSIQNPFFTFEGPSHSVTLNSFKISKFEIKQKEYLAIMGNNPSHFTGDLNKPVESVKWYDVLVFCNKLSIMKGLTPAYSINGSTNPNDWGNVPTTNNPIWDAVVCNWAANGYRMPTEAEWEYAAKGGTHYTDNYLYSGSNDVNAVAWYSINNTITPTHTVGGKQANQLGIYDMSGNVFEHCWDWFSFYSDAAQTNPTGSSTGTRRIIRGGGIDRNANFCKNEYRYYYPYGEISYIVGMRLVLPQ